MTEYLRKDAGLIPERPKVVDPISTEPGTITERTLGRDSEAHTLITPPPANVPVASAAMSASGQAPPSHAHVRKKGSPCL